MMLQWRIEEAKICSDTAVPMAALGAIRARLPGVTEWDWILWRRCFRQPREQSWKL